MPDSSSTGPVEKWTSLACPYSVWTVGRKPVRISAGLHAPAVNGAQMSHDRAGFLRRSTHIAIVAYYKWPQSRKLPLVAAALRSRSSTKKVQRSDGNLQHPPAPYHISFNASCA